MNRIAQTPSTSSSATRTATVTSLPAPRSASDRYPTEPLNADAAAALDRLCRTLGVQEAA